MSIKKSFCGSNIVEYSIPLAVVGVMIGLTLYSFSANDVLKNLVTTSIGGSIANDGSLTVGHKSVNGNIIQNNNPNNNPNNQPEVENENPNQTPPDNTNETNCSAGTCTLDFENFKLTGVPEDFSSFIKSNGVSGAEDVIGSLFKQIADQLATEPTSTEPTDQEIIKQIRVLAAYTGTDIDLQALYPTDNSFSEYRKLQHEASICALEYKIGGGNCNGNLSDSGNNIVQIYNTDFDISDPIGFLDGYTKGNSDKVKFAYDNFLAACNNSTSGKNYDKLKSTISFLKNQSISISKDFKTNYTVSDFNDPNYGQLNPEGLAAIRDNVASNAENFTSQLMQMTK